MEINATVVKQLRERTGVGMMECKSALLEASGDVTEAEKILRKRGVAAADKKSGRATGEGSISSYIHTGGKIGVLLEVNCETDFAARSEDFKALVHEIAMHIAAAAPRFVKREEVPEAVIAYESEIAKEQVIKSGKPAAVADKIVAGKVDKFLAGICLLEQPYVKDPEKTVKQMIGERVGKIGENIQVQRFVRFVLGETPESA